MLTPKLLPVSWLALILLSQFALCESSDAPVSIYTANDFASQRLCALGCFKCWNGGPFDCIADKLSCVGNPPMNSCYCRRDLQPAAESILSVCVKSACANTVDIASALSIRSVYCGANAPTTPPLSLPATTTIENSLRESGTAGVTTVVSVSMQTVTETAVSSSSTRECISTTAFYTVSKENLYH